MQMLYAKAATRNRQCLFVDFPTGMHMDTWLAGGDPYWRTIKDFLEQNVPEWKEDESPREGSGKFWMLIFVMLYDYVHLQNFLSPTDNLAYP